MSYTLTSLSINKQFFRKELKLKGGVTSIFHVVILTLKCIESKHDFELELFPNQLPHCKHFRLRPRQQLLIFPTKAFKLSFRATAQMF